MSYPRRPKISKMSRKEVAQFNATYPISVPFNKTEVCFSYGRDDARKLIHAFFDALGSQVATSGNKAYFTNETDRDLFLMGMWR